MLGWASASCRPSGRSRRARARESAARHRPAGSNLPTRQVLLPHRPGRVNMPDMNTNQSVEAIVIGGGAAGLSGALTLARARRSVMVIDSGEPRNAPAFGVHGFLSRDGIPPHDLVARGQEEAARYGGSVLPGRVVSAEHVGGLFEVMTARRRLEMRPRGVMATRRDGAPGVAGQWERVSQVVGPWARDAESPRSGGSAQPACQLCSSSSANGSVPCRAARNNRRRP